MNVTIALKCDRSGRIESIQVDSEEIAKYEAREAVRQETLGKIRDFFAEIPSEEMPDLIAVYRGEMRAFVNVSAEFCDKPVTRLLDQLFHASDPSQRKPRKPRKKKDEQAAEGGNGTKTEANEVQVAATEASSSEAVEQPAV